MTTLDHAYVAVWQDLFTTIIEDADSNILLLDDEFRVINLNPGFYWVFFETYGIELKKGTSILESMEGINPVLTRDWKERCMTAMSGTPIKVEDVFELEEKTFYWEMHFKSVTRPDGQQIVSVFSRDSTVRKAYQNRIIQNEANLRSILNTIQDSIWLVNSDFELIDFNKAFYRNYKSAYGTRLAKGKNILDLLPDHMPELRERWKVRYESGLKGRPGKYIDSDLVDNELRTYEIKTYPIIEHLKVTGLTVYSQDITAQTLAGELLKKKNEELTKINAELDRFVYSASHDLRAPLMSMKGLINMIKIDPEKKNTDHYVQLIERSIGKLDHFIMDIIHYSRNTRQEIERDLIDFNALLTESIESLKYTEGAACVNPIRHIAGDAPFYSDHSRLLMVFNNIIANAVQYRDRWKDNPFLEISVETSEARAVIRFRDNGVGIAAEYIDSIFKMFFRATADSKGSGLGLYIVKGAVDKLGGDIEVQSKLGVGSTFTIVIPNLKRD